MKRFTNSQLVLSPATQPRNLCKADRLSNAALSRREIGALTSVLVSVTAAIRAFNAGEVDLGFKCACDANEEIKAILSDA